MSAEPLLAPLQALLNRQIERSSAARQATRGLDGKTLALRLRNTGLVLYFVVNDGGLALSRDTAAEPDALLETTPLGLAELTRGEASGGRHEISGDPVVARRFEALLRETRPDWEEELSRIVGDVAAHQIGGALRALGAFGARAAASLSLDTAEYLREERRDLPAPAEIDAFCAAVSEIEARTKQLAGDIEHLRARLAG